MKKRCQCGERGVKLYTFKIAPEHQTRVKTGSKVTREYDLEYEEWLCTTCSKAEDESRRTQPIAEEIRYTTFTADPGKSEGSVNGGYAEDNYWRRYPHRRKYPRR